MQETKVNLEITLTPANREDFIGHNSQVKWGELYFLKSCHTGKFEGPFILHPVLTRLEDFASWIKADMVWKKKPGTDQFLEES